MGIRVLESPSPPGETERLVAGDPRAGLFHHPRWITALGRAYPRLRPRYLVLEEGGRVTAVTPMAVVRRLGLREIVSMPFGTHGGPVLAPDATPDGIHRLNARFVEGLRGPATYRFEMTVFDPPEALARSLEALLGPHLVPTTTYVLDLTPGADALWKGYQQQLRAACGSRPRPG